MILLAATGQLSTSARIVAAIVIIFFVGIVLELIRRRRLEERYAVIWILSGSILLLLTIFPKLLKGASDLVGIQDPVAALFAGLIVTLLFLVLHLTATSSRQDARLARISQELAILRAEQNPPEAEKEPRP